MQFPKAVDLLLGLSFLLMLSCPTKQTTEFEEPEEIDIEKQEFKTKAHYAPQTPYYLLNNPYAPVLRPLRPSYVDNRRAWTRPEYWQRSYRSTKPAILQQLRSVGATKFVDFLREADLHSVVDSAGFCTVFAPTNEAFDKFVDFRQTIKDDGTCLRDVLLQHIVPKFITTSGLHNGTKLETMAGNHIGVVNEKRRITVAGSGLNSNYLNLLASNGVIHLIDDVIYPFIKKSSARGLLDECEKPRDLEIETRNGHVRGYRSTSHMRSWLGIPFARPPTGKRRFSRPVPAENWTKHGILDATKAPNACPQSIDDFFGNFSGSQQWNPNTNISEDCLYLNIHAPMCPSDMELAEGLPVIVWIYGGGYTSGSSVLDLYDPSQIVKLGHVVFVSINYRVGSHGFLYMGKDTGAPGNMGMLDQVMALEWVRDNIKAFGGNPDEITLMGESAGANSVALHTLSPLSRQLFHRAILQSSGAAPRWGFVTREVALKSSATLARQLNCDRDGIEETLACLRSLNFEDITNAEYNVADNTLGFYPFIIVVDEMFLPQDPKIMMKQDIVKDKAFLVGSNADEGFYHLLYYLPDFPNEELSQKERAYDEKQYMDTVAKAFSFFPSKIRKLIAHEYRDKFEGSDRLFRSIERIAGDMDFTCDVEETAQVFSEAGNAVYRYYYNHKSSRDPWPSWSGSKHGDEIEFTFGHPLKRPRDYDAPEVVFARNIVSYWTNFAKFGNPNPPRSAKTWPKYQSPGWKYLNLTVNSPGEIGEKTFQEDCRFFIDVLPGIHSRNHDIIS